MTPLDLRATPPRSPYDELAGIVMLARTVDKARAQLPGGYVGGYWITPGMSAHLLAYLGFDEAAFVAIVADAADDLEVAGIVAARTTQERLARIDAGLRAVTVAQLEGDYVEMFPRIYGRCEPEERILDVLVRDDASVFS